MSSNMPDEVQGNVSNAINGSQQTPNMMHTQQAPNIIHTQQTPIQKDCLLPMQASASQVMVSTGKARLQCYACQRLLEYDAGAQYVQCFCCHTMNAVLPDNVIGGQVLSMLCAICHTTNLAPYGVTYVRCGKCNTISQVSHAYIADQIVPQNQQSPAIQQQSPVIQQQSPTTQPNIPMQQASVQRHAPLGNDQIISQDINTVSHTLSDEDQSVSQGLRTTTDPAQLEDLTMYS